MSLCQKYRNRLAFDWVIAKTKRGQFFRYSVYSQRLFH